MDCEVVFFPNKANEQKIIDFINQAKKELKICVFTFTNQNIAMAILNKVLKEKVKVRIITDDVQNESKYSIVDVLQSASDDLIKFRTDLRKDAHMHHKYVVIDDKYIATGSFNWTQAAVMKNNENLLLISEQSIAKQYSKNFDELWEQFKTTEMSLSKLASDIKERGKTFKNKWIANPTGAVPQKRQYNRAKKATDNNKLGDIIEIVDDDEEDDDKVKRSAKSANQTPTSATATTVTSRPQRNGRQRKVINPLEKQQLKENKQKTKKIQKVLKLSKVMQTKRVVLENKMSESRQKKIKTMLQNAVSFALGALTVGTGLFLQQFF